MIWGTWKSCALLLASSISNYALCLLSRRKCQVDKLEDQWFRIWDPCFIENGTFLSLSLWQLLAVDYYYYVKSSILYCRGRRYTSKKRIKSILNKFVLIQSFGLHKLVYLWIKLKFLSQKYTGLGYGFGM